MAGLWLSFLSCRLQLHLTEWAGAAAAVHLLPDTETGFIFTVERDIYPKGEEAW